MFANKTFRNLGLLRGAFLIALATLTLQVSYAADPPARTSLLKSVEPLWVDLSASQKSFLKPLEKQWYELTTSERKSWVALANKVPKLAPAEQRKANAKILEWAALSPEQRKLARENYRLAQNLPKEEREQLWKRYESLTPAQQAVLRSNGWTSDTAAKHAGDTSGLAKQSSQPIKDIKAKVQKPLPGRLAAGQSSTPQ